MKIRSITNFFHPGTLFADQTLENLTSLTVETKKLISSAGFRIPNYPIGNTPISNIVSF